MIEDNAIRFEVRYPYPPERIWQALTDPAELARWLMPAVGFAPAAGRRFTMSCGPPIGEIDGEVVEADPPRWLSLRWNAAFGETTVSFQLIPEGTGTRLTLVHGGWDAASLAARDQFDSGWVAKLRHGLAAVLGQAP